MTYSDIARRIKDAHKECLCNVSNLLFPLLLSQHLGFLLAGFECFHSDWMTIAAKEKNFPYVKQPSEGNSAKRHMISSL